MSPWGEELTFTTVDGLRLRGLRSGSAPGRGTVLIVHGLGEHAGRYDLVAGFLSDRGFCVVSYDQRGHGRSQGPRTYTPTFDHLLEDLAVAERRLVASGARLVYWAHSMGGLILLRYLQTRASRARAAVISAPWLATAAMGPLRRRLGSMISHVLPRLLLRTGSDGSALMRDPERLALYQNDPLVTRSITLRLFEQVCRAQSRALAEPERLRLPLLFAVPLHDSLVDPEVTLAFARSLSDDRTEIVELPGWRHEPHNEPERIDLFARIGDWLEANPEV